MVVELVWLLVMVFVFFLIGYGVMYVVDWMSVPDKLRMPVRVIVGLILIIVLIGMLVGGIPGPHKFVW